MPTRLLIASLSLWVAVSAYADETVQKLIERGAWKEPVHTPFIPRDDWGNRIEKIDLRALAREKTSCARENIPENTPFIPPTKFHAPIDERDLYGASSLADRIRIVP